MTMNLHPHLARLDRFTLDVRYRASAEPQDLQIRIAARPNGSRTTDYPARLGYVVDMVNSGLAGGALFPPEQGSATILDGPRPLETITDNELTWTLRVQAVDPHWFAIALDMLADDWSVADNLVLGERFATDPSFYPDRVSIQGQLEPDDSPLSATSALVLAWLRDPSEAYAPWKEVPFAVKERPVTKGARLRLKVGMTDRPTQRALSSRLSDLAFVLNAHPGAGWPNSPGRVAATKTMLTVAWDEFPCPRSIARGPILNLVRAFHSRVTPVGLLEMELP